MFGEPILNSSREFLTNENVFVQWIVKAASLMNTTASQSVHSCYFNIVDLSEVCYHQHFQDKKVSIDLFGYYVTGPTASRLFSCLYSNLQSDIALLAPRSALNIVEIFTLPFSWQLWMFLAILLIIVEVVHLILPNVFRNEPILTVVCGYEKYDLHKANQWEKILLLSLIVMMFFITQAYEIKLLSMMISRPATKELKTLAELRSSGVKIKADFLRHPGTKNNPQLENLVVNGSEEIFNMDMVHAYVLDREWAKVVLPMYYDPVQRLQRYSIMEQSLGVYPVMIMLQKRGPFMEHFRVTLSGFVESGIYDFMSKLDKKKVVNISVANQSPNARVSLNFVDLLPAWLAWLFGFAASFLVFCLEIVVNKMVKVLIKKHSRK